MKRLILIFQYRFKHMNIIRLYKLQKLGIEIGESETKILNYLNIVFNDLKSFTLKDYIGQLLFVNQNNEFIFCLIHEKIIFVQSEHVWKDMRILLNSLEINSRDHKLRINSEIINLQEIFKDYINIKFSMSANNVHIIEKYDYDSIVFQYKQTL